MLKGEVDGGLVLQLRQIVKAHPLQVEFLDAADGRLAVLPHSGSLAAPAEHNVPTESAAHDRRWRCRVLIHADQILALV
eukprot:4962322-Pyramimonas_sp.AAC.1